MSVMKISEPVDDWAAMVQSASPQKSIEPKTIILPSRGSTGSLKSNQIYEFKIEVFNIF
jgi:hypothetical protein